MDAKEFGLSILEYFISNIPTILVMVVALLNNMNKIKKEVSNFDLSVKTTENNVIDKVDVKVNQVLENVQTNLNKTIDKVDLSLDKISGTIDNFASKIGFLETQVGHLFKSNKIAFDIISILISGKEDMVNKGVASIIVDKMRMSKEEFEMYPELIASNKEAFVNAIKEQFVLLGKENFETLIIKTLKEIGYEEAKDEEL